MTPPLSPAPSGQDEQALKLKKVISYMLEQSNGSKVMVLDYGAGQARLAYCLHEMAVTSEQDDVLKKVHYFYYDEHRPKNLKLPQGGWAQTISKNVLKQKTGEFDIIVLFNVLHEISVENWETTLNFILSLLSNDGFLIFGERKTLSKGEDPYGKSGYLVLGTDEVRELFNHKDIEDISLANTYPIPSEKTSCCIVKKVNKPTVTSDSVENALSNLFSNTKKEINGMLDKLKSNGENKVSGRLYAFYCQQYFNTERALSILDAAPPKIDEEALAKLRDAHEKNNISSWDTWRESSNKPVIELAQVDLSGTGLSKANLKGVNLKKANLEGAKLKEANLERANLVGANLFTAVLRDADLRDAKLVGADLGGANLEETKLERAVLEYVKLELALLPKARLDNAIINNANLRGAVLEKAVLEKAVLKNAKLKGANLGWAKLEGAILDEANFTGANLFMADLREAELRKTILEGAKLDGAILDDADFTGTNLKRARINKESFTKTKHEGVVLDEVIFI